MTVYITPTPTNTQRPANRSAKPTTAKQQQSIVVKPGLLDMRQAQIMMGVPIDNLTMDETLNRIEKMVDFGRKTGKVHQIATVNTDFLVKAQDDENLRTLLQNADMCTADGMPLVWGSQILGHPLKERVAGSDMVPRLAERAAQTGLRLYFLGGAPGVADQAKTILEQRYPGVKIVGCAAPFWKVGEQMDGATLADIRRSKADILLVALGNPKQEHWIQTYGEQVGVPVQIGVGASLDFIVGVTKRAPTWMQKTGLEWLSRLVQEPRRLWKRYANNFIEFGPNLMKQWWMMRNNVEISHTPFVVESRSIGNTAILNISGSLDHRQVRTLMRQGQRALGSHRHLTINLADVEHVDCTSISALMELTKLTRSNNGQFRLVGIRDNIGQMLDELKASSFFEVGEFSYMVGSPY